MQRLQSMHKAAQLWGATDAEPATEFVELSDIPNGVSIFLTKIWKPEVKKNLNF
jgi:hypothetical protein